MKNTHLVWKLAAAVLELLDTKPGERILDLGCGRRHLTAKIADAGAQVVGGSLARNDPPGPSEISVAAV